MYIYIYKHIYIFIYIYIYIYIHIYIYTHSCPKLAYTSNCQQGIRKITPIGFWGSPLSDNRISLGPGAGLELWILPTGYSPATKHSNGESIICRSFSLGKHGFPFFFQLPSKSIVYGWYKNGGGLSLSSVWFKSALNDAKMQGNWLHGFKSKLPGMD